jgi:hypothetical protein
LDSDVDQEEAKRANVVVDVEHRSGNVVELNTLILLSTVLRPQSLICDFALALVEKPALAWGCRHEEGCTKAGKYGYKTFKKEDVAPRVDDHAGSSPWGDSTKPEARLAVSL